VEVGLWTLAYCLNANISLISALHCQHWPLIFWQPYLYEVLQTELAELWVYYSIFIAYSFIWWTITMIICNPHFVCIINRRCTYHSFLFLSSHHAFAFSSALSSSFFSSLSSSFCVCCSAFLSYSDLYEISQGVSTKFRTVALNIILPQFGTFFLSSFWDPKILNSPIDFWEICASEISLFVSY
jgi:hypothetical protein